MNPQIQFLFFLAGAACFFMATFRENWPPHWRMSQGRYTALGLLFFTIPFAYNAATSGW